MVVLLIKGDVQRQSWCLEPNLSQKMVLNGSLGAQRHSSKERSYSMPLFYCLAFWNKIIPDLPWKVALNSVLPPFSTKEFTFLDAQRSGAKMFSDLNNEQVLGASLPLLNAISETNILKTIIWEKRNFFKWSN